VNRTVAKYFFKLTRMRGLALVIGVAVAALGAVGHGPGGVHALGFHDGV
jgi:hypothetical protein